MEKVDQNEKELKSLGEQEYELNQERISLKNQGSRFFQKKKNAFCS